MQLVSDLDFHERHIGIIICLVTFTEGHKRVLELVLVYDVYNHAILSCHSYLSFFNICGLDMHFYQLEIVPKI